MFQKLRPQLIPPPFLSAPSTSDCSDRKSGLRHLIVLMLRSRAAVTVGQNSWSFSQLLNRVLVFKEKFFLMSQMYSNYLNEKHLTFNRFMVNLSPMKTVKLIILLFCLILGHELNIFPLNHQSNFIYTAPVNKSNAIVIDRLI